MFANSCYASMDIILSYLHSHFTAKITKKWNLWCTLYYLVIIIIIYYYLRVIIQQ